MNLIFANSDCFISKFILKYIASNVYKYLEKKYGSAYKGSSGIKKI